MMHLKAFFHDKQARDEWNAFVSTVMDEEALKLVYAGKETAAIKEARAIINRSFKKLDELFTPKKKREPKNRSV